MWVDSNHPLFFDVLPQMLTVVYIEVTSDQTHTHTPPPYITIIIYMKILYAGEKGANRIIIFDMN